MTPKRILIAGANGFLGGLLTRHWLEQGHELRHLSRRESAQPAVKLYRWDGVQRGEWEAALEGVDVLVNLCGASVNCRYTPANRKRLMDSRILPTRLLGEALRDREEALELWLQASTATLYKHTLGTGWDESGELGSDPRAKDAFSIELAQAWEDEFYAVLPSNCRGVSLRTAMVLGRGEDPNNVLCTLRRLTRLGLGGSMGKGNQYVSWIHEQDFCQALDWIMEHRELRDALNLSAPHPLPNRDMMQLFRKQYHRPWSLPAPEALLELGAFFMRTETELIIKSRRVFPAKLQQSGFPFRYSHFADALNDLAGGTH